MATRYEVDLIADIKEYSAKRRIKSLGEMLRLLGEECGELAEAVANHDEAAIVEEAADVALIALHFLVRHDRTIWLPLASKMDTLEVRHQYRGTLQDEVDRNA